MTGGTRVARLAFAVAVFAVPIVFDPTSLDAFNLVKLTTFWVLAVIAAGALASSSALGSDIRAVARSPLALLGIALLAVTLVASLLSPSPVLSILGFYRRYEGFASIALYVATMLFIPLLYRRRPASLRDLAVAVAASSGIVGAYVCFQKLGIDVADWRQADRSKPPFPIGSIGNSAFTASFFGMAAPLIVYLFVTTKETLKRTAVAAAGVLTLAGLVLTQGRSGMIAAAAGAIGFFLFGTSLGAKAKLGAAVAMLAVLVFLPFAVRSDLQSTETVLRTYSVAYRTEVWAGSVRMVRERPVFGWGPESFYGEYARFRSAEQARRDGLVIPDKAHNIFLGWATTTGIVGLVLYLALAGTALYRAGTTSRDERGVRTLRAAFAGALIAYLAQGLFSLDVPPLALLGWVFLGCLLALDVVARDVAPVVIRPSRVRTAVAVVVVAVLAFVGTRPLRADHAAYDAQSRAREGWSDETAADFQRAIDLNPTEAAYRVISASYFERIARDRGSPYSTESAFRLAVELYADALRIQPHNIQYLISAAQASFRLGAVADDAGPYRTAERWLRRAVDLDPNDPRIHAVYAELLERYGPRAPSKAMRRELRERATDERRTAAKLTAA